MQVKTLWTGFPVIWSVYTYATVCALLSFTSEHKFGGFSHPRCFHQLSKHKINVWGISLERGSCNPFAETQSPQFFSLSSSQSASVRFSFFFIVSIFPPVPFFFFSWAGLNRIQYSKCIISFMMHHGEQNQILSFQFPMLRSFKKCIHFLTFISDSTQHLFMAWIKYSKVRLHHNVNDTIVNWVAFTTLEKRFLIIIVLELSQWSELWPCNICSSAKTRVENWYKQTKMCIILISNPELNNNNKDTRGKKIFKPSYNWKAKRDISLLIF